MPSQPLTSFMAPMVRSSSRLIFFFVLGEHQSCVPLRKLHQPPLLPLLRNDQLHLLAALGTQPLSDDPAVLQLRLNPEFPRDKRSSGIELLDKAG